MLVWIIIVAKISNVIYTEITKPDQNQEFHIGETMNFAGEISNENNFPLYTHKITSRKWEVIFLKSSNINLNKYSWKLEIHWEIKDIKKDIPILEVISIKFPEQGLIIKNNTYFFVKDMLYLDFSNQSQLSAKKEKKEIKIFYWEEKLSSAERFLCSRVLRQRDCTYLIEDYGNSQKENFDSYRWYTYYKHGTWLWTVFDGTMFWYIFKDIEEETMLSLSNIIKIVDKNFIVNNKKEVIKEACASKWEIIQQIGSTSVQYEDNNQVHITVETAKSDNRCKVTFDMRNEWEITQVQIIKK